MMVVWCSRVQSQSILACGEPAGQRLASLVSQNQLVINRDLGYGSGLIDDKCPYYSDDRTNSLPVLFALYNKLLHVDLRARSLPVRFAAQRMP